MNRSRTYENQKSARVYYARLIRFLNIHKWIEWYRKNYFFSKIQWRRAQRLVFCFIRFHNCILKNRFALFRAGRVLYIQGHNTAMQLLLAGLTSQQVE